MNTINLDDVICALESANTEWTSFIIKKLVKLL